MRRIISMSFGLAIAACAATAAVDRAGAVGAVALAQGGSQTTFGVAADFKTADEASQIALKHCQNGPGGSSCKIVATFTKQCASFAFGPKANPSFGWSLGANRQASQAKALEMCKGLSKDKKARCAIEWTSCDR
jgi:hypothetical protein